MPVIEGGQEREKSRFAGGVDSRRKPVLVSCMDHGCRPTQALFKVSRETGDASWYQKSGERTCRGRPNSAES